MLPSSRASVDDLLLSLFTEDTLRIFLGRSPNMDGIRDHLPSPPASLHRLATEAVELLDKHGRLDERFFELLRGQFPLRDEDIRKVADVIFSPPPPPPLKGGLRTVHEIPDEAEVHAAPGGLDDVEVVIDDSRDRKVRVILDEREPVELVVLWQADERAKIPASSVRLANATWSWVLVDTSAAVRFAAQRRQRIAAESAESAYLLTYEPSEGRARRYFLMILLRG